MHIVFSPHFLHNAEWFAIGFASAIIVAIMVVCVSLHGFDPFPV